MATKSKIYLKDEKARRLIQKADALGIPEAASLAFTAIADISYAADLDKASGGGSSKAWSLRSTACRKIKKAEKLIAAAEA